MHIDLYTKTIVTLIAVLLGVHAIRPLLHPSQTVQAQAPYNDIQFSGRFSKFGGGFFVFDMRSGDIWEYAEGANGYEFFTHWKITQLGKPLQRIPRE